MFVVKKSRNRYGGGSAAKKAATGYVSSSIFKPTDSESEIDAHVINYEPVQQYYNGTLTPQKQRYGRPHHNTQKIIKLKQLKIKQHQQQQEQLAAEHGGFMFQRRKPNQPPPLSRNSYLTKKSNIGTTSLPRIQPVDSLTNTPRNQRVYQGQAAHRLSPGQVHMSPPLSNIEGGYGEKKRGGTPNGVVRNQSRPPSWNARTQPDTSIQQQEEPNFKKSFNSLPILPGYQQSQGAHFDTAGTQSDVMAGNASPSLNQFKNKSRSQMKLKDLQNDQRIFQQSQKKLIDSSTLPNCNLSQSEINRINDLHEQVLNQQLTQQLQFNQQMTEGTASRNTHASTVNLNKPPLILNNQLAMKKQRRRQIQVQEQLERHPMNQQTYGHQPAYYLPQRQNKLVRSAPSLYDPSVSAMDDDQHLPQMPYTIVPMDQPIMMLNQSSQGPPILLQPPGYPSLQPMHYGGYGDMLEIATPDGSQQYTMQSTDSGSEKIYYQMVPSSVETQQKIRRPMYNRSLNAIENWAQLTQGLIELKKYRIQEKILLARGVNKFAQGIEFDTEEVREVESELQFDRTSNSRADLRAPRQHASQNQAKKRWQRANLKLKQQGYQLYDSQENGVDSQKREVVPTKPKGLSSKTVANWTRFLLKLQEKSAELQEDAASDAKAPSKRSSKLTSKPISVRQKQPESSTLSPDKSSKRKEVYRRWNKILRKVFRRIKSMQAQENIERWTVLINKLEMTSGGEFTLKRPETQAEIAHREKQEHTLRVMARWLRFTKKLQKNQKLNRLETLGNWKKLVDGILKQHSNAAEEKQLKISGKWRKLAINILRKNEKQQSLEVIGKWNILIQKFMSSDFRLKKLKYNAKWRFMAIKMLQKQKKVRHLRSVGNWKKIYDSLKKYEFAIYQERKTKKLQVYGVWTKFARQMLTQHNRTNSLKVIGRWRVLLKGLQEQRKIKSLEIIGRWRTVIQGLKNIKAKEVKQQRTKSLMLASKWKYCARILLQRHRKTQSLVYRYKWQQFANQMLDKNKNQQSFRVLKRWQNIIKMLANVVGSDLNLQSLKNMKMTEQIERLEEHNEKVVKMEVLGKWNIISHALLQKHNKIQAKQDKIQRMLIIGKWNIMTRQLLEKEDVHQRWTNLVTKMYIQNGAAFGLNHSISFKAETLMQRLQASQKDRNQDESRKTEIRQRLGWLAWRLLKYKKQRKMMAQINLRRLAIKLLKNEQKKDTVNKWKLLANSVIALLKDDSQQNKQIDQQPEQKVKKPIKKEIVGKWAKMTVKLIKKNDGRSSMVARINLSRLAHKLLKRQQEQHKSRAQERESRVLSYDRQEKAQRRLRNLTTKLLVIDAKKRSKRAQMNFGKLTQLLLKREATRKRSLGHRRVGTPSQALNKDQWRQMYMQLHHSKTAVVIKKHEKRPHKRTNNLGPIDKWELLTAYLVTKKQQEKSKNNVLKWKKFVVKLLQQGEDNNEQ